MGMAPTSSDRTRRSCLRSWSGGCCLASSAPSIWSKRGKRSKSISPGWPRSVAPRKTSAISPASSLAWSKNRETARDSAAFVDADVEFHLRLAETARNSALRDVLSSIQALLRAWIGRVIAEGHRDISYAEHVPIFEAVRARDARTAEDAMDAHMRSAAGRLQATLDRASSDADVIDPSAAARSAS